ncbi:MAG: Bax inhibitor-1/YccA family protein [Coxiellaceae bacterium]|jgi:modulator of FtsH protease|nr:Bax inhibitor-1/YccA family protein [Coxiellaceae bacterium]
MQFENQEYTILSQKETILPVNKVLQKTYFLLSLTLFFSTFVALVTIMGLIPYAGPAFTIIGMFGLMFLAQACRNSKWGLFTVFAFTGFMGYTLAPLLSFYLQFYNNGGNLIITALGGTGFVFTVLSLYTLISRKNFDYMAGFLFAAITAVFLTSVAGIFLDMPILSVLVSCAFILISSGLILLQTSQIVNGGERNYIMATISLYTSLFNLFVSLLNVLGFFAGNRRN